MKKRDRGWNSVGERKREKNTYNLRAARIAEVDDSETFRMCQGFWQTALTAHYQIVEKTKWMWDGNQTGLDMIRDEKPKKMSLFAKKEGERLWKKIWNNSKKGGENGWYINPRKEERKTNSGSQFEKSGNENDLKQRYLRHIALPLREQKIEDQTKSPTQGTAKEKQQGGRKEENMKNEEITLIKIL